MYTPKHVQAAPPSLQEALTGSVVKRWGGRWMQEEKLITRPGVVSWALPLLCGLCCSEGLAQMFSKPRVQPQKAEGSTSASRPLGLLHLSDTSLPQLAQGRAERSLPGKEMWF